MLTTVKEIINSLSDLLKNKLRKDREQADNFQAALNKRQLDYQIYTLMLAMQEALYDVFGHRDIDNIKLIKSAPDIRIVDYKIVNDGYIYIFELASQKEDIYQKITEHKLREIKRKMNIDIFQRQQYISHLYGVDYLMINHPLLYHGIYVMKIKEFSYNSLLLCVATNIQP